MKPIQPGYLITAIVLVTLACGQAALPSSGDETAAPTAPPTPLPVQGGSSEHRCGDGICDGPETAENCPADCGGPVAPPASAESAAEPRFGIDYVYPLTPDYQQEKWPQRFAETGAKWVNFAKVGWNAIEPNPPQNGEHQYNWSKLDAAVRVWQKYGFQIAISLRLGNGWFAGPIKYPGETSALGELLLQDTDRLPAPEHTDSYRAWITALVERYDADGQDDMPNLRAPVLYYQVGNEYANPLFWSSTLEDYRILLEETASAARSASAEVKIISNGIRWNDLFHNDPNAEFFEERFAAFLENLPSDDLREGWQLARIFTEGTVAMADLYDILDAGGNGPYETASAGYMAWVQGELAKSGLTSATVWDMEARSEPRLTYNATVNFHPELTVPDGEKILSAMKTPSDPLHDQAVAWYRAEQSRILVKVFVTRFAAGFEKVFMGMPNDWDKSLGALATPNPYMGLTDSVGNPWPAFYALQLLVEKIDGFAYAEKMPAESGVELYRFTFTDGRPTVWVAWLWEDQLRGMNDPLSTRQVRLDISNSVTIYSIPTTGEQYETTRLEASQEGLLTTLSPEPLIIQEE